MLQVGLVLTNHNIILRDNSIVQSSECWCCDSELFSCLQWLGCKGLSGLRFTLLLPKYGSTTQYRYKFSIVAKKFWYNYYFLLLFRVKLVHREMPNSIFGKRAGWIQHVSDLARIQVRLTLLMIIQLLSMNDLSNVSTVLISTTYG